MLSRRDDTLPLRSHGTLPDGVRFIEVDVTDHVAFTALPKAVEFDGRLYARTGWDSDRCVAFFRTDAAMARVVA